MRRFPRRREAGTVAAVAKRFARWEAALCEWLMTNTTIQRLRMGQGVRWHPSRCTRVWISPVGKLLQHPPTACAHLLCVRVSVPTQKHVSCLFDRKPLGTDIHCKKEITICTWFFLWGALRRCRSVSFLFDMMCTFNMQGLILSARYLQYYCWNLVDYN